jgi:uncharacterized protein (DUF58 family)
MSKWEHWKRWRNTLLGSLIVLCGVVAAVVTVRARRAGDWELARMAAISSLVLAGLIVLFVVPPLARSARAEAARLDLPFQATPGGVIFVGIYVVVAFAAWNTGNNLLFLIFSVLTSTLFVAWSAARVTLRDLFASARFPDHIFAGESAPVVVTVNNMKRLLPSFSVVVEARLRDGEGRAAPGRFRRRAGEQRRVLAYFMYVPHRSKVEQRVEQVFARRGRVVVTGFELSTRFPFGFFRLRQLRGASEVEIIVYPKPEVAGDELHLLPIDAGRTESARRGRGHDLYSLREYQPRDEVRHIDWKATARLGRLVVREFTAEEDRRVHVALDTTLGEGEDASERFERGVTLAATLAQHFLDERSELRLTIGEDDGRYGSGREHLYDSLRRLALTEPVNATDATDAARRREDFYRRFAPAASRTASGYVILLTTARPGTIPSDLWRKSHVIYL